MFEKAFYVFLKIMAGMFGAAGTTTGYLFLVKHPLTQRLFNYHFSLHVSFFSYTEVFANGRNNDIELKQYEKRQTRLLVSERSPDCSDCLFRFMQQK